MMRKSVNKSLLFIAVFSLSITGSAQKSMFKSDIEHINAQLSQIQPDPYKRPYIYKNEPSLIKKINPVGLLFGGSLYLYQNVFSKHISADCLYTPSCSEFSKQAIREEGLLKGTILTIDRVNRCNRIAAQDLKYYNTDKKTNRYPDPVSRYRKAPPRNGR
jgi:putative membrane protein insertion efficiency factor